MTGADAHNLQAGLFSTSLTSFIIDSKQNLKVNPADQMVYYLQQNVAMLAQISQQMTSIAPQISIPSSSPPPYPGSSPSPSDIRVNVFWFMALVFSLSAALLAILVQQWVRDYMHVFLRYSDPLKCARLRQYLHDGSEKWYMPIVAEAVPGLLHISLFLFFAGLGDLVLGINTAAGLSTVIPIGIIGLLYIFTMFAPVMYPQSPYQNSFSGLIWYIFQRLHGRTYKDRGSNGASKPVSATMSEGQMQLAMEENEERMIRDERAIRWMINDMTEETEMEQLVVTIPGSLNADWGREVWGKVFKDFKANDEIANESELTAVLVAERNTSVPMPVARAVRPSLRVSPDRNRQGLDPLDVLFPSDTASSQEVNIMHELCRRVAHLLETCKNRGHFASDEQWRKRTRACVETTASLVGCASVELGWFGEVGRLLGDIGNVENAGELMSTGKDRSFVLRWTCLSVMSIRLVLNGNSPIRNFADGVIEDIKSLGDEESSGDKQIMENAQIIGNSLDYALSHLSALYWAFTPKLPNLTEGIKDLLRNHESLISDLERISAEADNLTMVDDQIERLLRHMDECTQGITHQLPEFRNRFSTGPVPLTEILKLFVYPHQFPIIIPPGQVLKSLCSVATTFRDILDIPEGQDVEINREAFKNLEVMGKIDDQRFDQRWASRLFQRQLWRMEDLAGGHGLGSTVELFFIALRQLLSTSLSQESQSALYVGTFRAITSDWSSHKHCVGTQKVLLDMVASSHGIFSDFSFPTIITDELLRLLRNVLDKQSGPHIDDTVGRLREKPRSHHPGVIEFRSKALEDILRSKISASTSPSP